MRISRVLLFLHLTAKDFSYREAVPLPFRTLPGTAFSSLSRLGGFASKLEVVQTETEIPLLMQWNGYTTGQDRTVQCYGYDIVASIQS